jgi:hypothetical protein
VSARPVNPLVGDIAGERSTALKTSSPIYLQFTADSYAASGSSAHANDGLVLILEAVVDALDAAMVQMASTKWGAS